MRNFLPLIFHNFFYKLLSLLLAFLIWFLVQEEETENYQYREIERMQEIEK